MSFSTLEFFWLWRKKKPAAKGMNLEAYCKMYLYSPREIIRQTAGGGNRNLVNQLTLLLDHFGWKKVPKAVDTFFKHNGFRPGPGTAANVQLEDMFIRVCFWDTF